MVSSKAQTVEGFLAALPADKRKDLERVLSVVRRHLPRGYAEEMQFGMISWGVPLERYPDTYNGKPLCYAALAAQKNYLSLYLMGAYGNAETRAWFQKAYADAGRKLDMGQSCVRFRSVDELPLDVIGKAIARTPVDRFIADYEAARASQKPRRASAPRSRKSPARKAKAPAASRRKPAR